MLAHRKTTVLDSGVFPILKIENFLSDSEYEEIKEEVKKQVLRLKDPDSTVSKDFYKLHLTKGKIRDIIDKNLFDKNMMDIYANIPETAFKLIPSSTHHETEITVYDHRGSYTWHEDCKGSRIANYVLMIDLGMKFEGGHTQFSNTGESDTSVFSALNEVSLDIKPKGNQLIIMPTWVLHKVTQIKPLSKNLLHTRITVNGHIAFEEMKFGGWQLE